MSPSQSGCRHGTPHCLDQRRTGVLPCSNIAGEIDANTLGPLIRLQPKSEAQAIGEFIAASIASIAGMRSGQQGHRIDVSGVHVRDDAGRRLGQRV
jgi:hypothetical protein